ncbi:hypothetical protein KFL_012060020 [Klebsormidium nitens]|uniref:Uncharacterized protein n=1 Tax=Klebsormidium nitens TaxID=105231 RepID=A0A1Y1IXC0_KLENI|nr:hypothetical protein KFL_012060020 [Klebsormidium nitens]|eukprot:GAQ92928.1 hypothetical protein KFL_012060020 [Klebsormidium nitens]
MARKSTGRKRERGDHSVEPNKREHSDTTDERVMEPALRLEDMHEVEELTDAASGGLAFPAGVIKMLDIMHTVQLDADAGAHATEQVLTKRALLAKIVASTSRADCAALFLREGGLAQLQAWLGEAMDAAAEFADDPSVRAHVERLLIALLIAVERLREQAERLQEGTMGLVAALASPEAQFSDQVKLRARRLGSSWGADGRRRSGGGGGVWDGAGESSTSGAEVAVESKGDTSPSTSAERDESADTVSSRAGSRAAAGVGAAGQRDGKGSAGEGRGGRDAGVEEAAGIMRLNMNSPVAGAPLPPSFGGAPEEGCPRGGNEGQEPERSKYAKIDTAAGSMPGGLPGGAPHWGPQPHEGGPRLRRGRWGTGRQARGSSDAGATAELAGSLAALRVCGNAGGKGMLDEGASRGERRHEGLHRQELPKEASGGGAGARACSKGGRIGASAMRDMTIGEDLQLAGTLNRMDNDTARSANA